eukprot:14958940-Heterocapsa_arctica.AAC.1
MVMAIEAALSTSRSLTVASPRGATWKVRAARAIALSVGADTVPLMPSTCAPHKALLNERRHVFDSRPCEPYRKQLSFVRNVRLQRSSQGGGQLGWDTRVHRRSRTSRSAGLRGCPE